MAMADSPVMGSRVTYLGTVDSTNERLRELFEGGAAEGTVVVAERQTQGRGRQGRSWASPSGGLYVSVLLTPGPEDAPLVTLLAGVAVVRALGPLGVEARLKWPNDVLVGGHKVGGILGEGVHRGDRFALILGVGLNANVPLEKLPRGVTGGATSLSSEIGRRVDLDALLRRVLGELERLRRTVDRGPRGELLAEYRGLCVTLGQRVVATAAKGRVEGTAVDITPEGYLLVKDGRGEVHRILDATLTPPRA